jgi:hypothetical protein
MAMEDWMSIVRFTRATPNVADAALRRRSLVALGWATVASAVAAPSVVQAGKLGKKSKKRKRKKCRRQIDQCLDAIAAFCEGEESCINNYDLCCPLLSNCRAGASLDCLFAHVG